MIRKSENRFSEKIMLKQRNEIMMRFRFNRIMIWTKSNIRVAIEIEND